MASDIVGRHLLLSVCLLAFQFSKVLVEVRNGLDAFEEVEKRIVLVGRVDGVAAKSEAHQDALYTKNALEAGNNRYASAAASGDGALAEGGCKSLFSCLVCIHFERADVCSAAVGRSNLDCNAVGGCSLEVVLKELAYLFKVLVGYQSGRNLGISFAWQDCLAAFAGMSTPDTTHRIWSAYRPVRQGSDF